MDNALKPIPYFNKNVSFVKIITLREKSQRNPKHTNLQLCKSEIVSKLKKKKRTLPLVL